MYEEIEYFNLADGYPKEPRGEYVLIVKGLETKINELNDLSILDHYNYYINLGMQNNDAIKQVAKDMGVAKNVIYNHIVEVKKK